MDYVPHTTEEILEMIHRLGLSSTEELFTPIPEELRSARIDLTAPKTEMEIWQEMIGWNSKLTKDRAEISFIGGGAYEHFIPAVVDEIISRGEFYTSYTPYQAEISQGTLQTIFEFQTMICELTGMDVANASIYDGASALAEAVLMAMRINGKKNVLVPESLNPFYRQVISTYLGGSEEVIITIPTTDSGTIDLNFIVDQLTDETSAVIVQNPNFFGCLEPVAEIGEILKDNSIVYIASVNPISLGLIAPPGEYGAHIAVGEGQPLGIPLSFGGPYLGFFASKMEFIRRMPGRIVGETVDSKGHTGYVLTVQTREQHIRREKATSNICTNQALCALMASVYLASLGPNGLAEVGQLNWDTSHYLAHRLSEFPGIELRHTAPFFNEFVIRSPLPARSALEGLRVEGILGGLPLGQWFPERENEILVCCTETKSLEEIDRYVDAWKKVL